MPSPLVPGQRLPEGVRPNHAECDTSPSTSHLSVGFCGTGSERAATSGRWAVSNATPAVHRDPHATHAHARHDRPPRRSPGRTGHLEPDHGPRRPNRLIPIPDPRPRQQAHPRISTTCFALTAPPSSRRHRRPASERYEERFVRTIRAECTDQLPQCNHQCRGQLAPSDKHLALTSPARPIERCHPSHLYRLVQQHTPLRIPRRHATQ